MNSLSQKVFFPPDASSEPDTNTEERLPSRLSVRTVEMMPETDTATNPTTADALNMAELEAAKEALSRQVETLQKERDELQEKLHQATLLAEKVTKPEEYAKAMARMDDMQVKNVQRHQLKLIPPLPDNH